MSSETAKAITSVGIWGATAVILAFGLFKMNFHGDGSNFLFFALTTMIIGVAAYSTAIVWRGPRRVE